MTSIAGGSFGLLIVVAQFNLGAQRARPALPASAEPRASSVADQVVRDLCDKRIALLGESPTHGFGRTLEFKVDIARRLIDECHYNAFLIESGAYDFLNIRTRLESGGTITQAMIAAAIGGLWANREVAPLVPFLLARVQGGALVLGGLDDQLARGTYAQNQMPADLVEFLRGDDRATCLEILQRQTLWRYTDDAPYGRGDREHILGCLDKIQPNLSAAKSAVARDDAAAMIENLRRTFARDFMEGDDLETRSVNDRDHSMYVNFQWWMSRLPANSKVIVWTAITHAAKDLRGVAGEEKLVPLGSYIRREFKDDAFVLAFSAYAGTYGMARQPARALVTAPANSLEGLAFAQANSDTRYLDTKEIRASGRIAARALGPDFKTASWEKVLDGLVVFREERPPQIAGPEK